MKTILFIRHADAELHQFTSNDIERNLTLKGENQSKIRAP